MNDEQIGQFMEWCRYLANSPDVDRVIANHAKGILVRVATVTGGIK